MESKPLVYILLFLLMGTNWSCVSNTFNSKEELLEYLINEENGYYFKKSSNGINYVLTYRPTDLLVNQELSKDYNQNDVSKLREKYSKYLYFNLSMSANGQELLNLKAGNKHEFGAMVNQLAFNMENKVNFISQNLDTIPMLDYVYPRMYGMGKGTDMLLVFERKTRLLEQAYARVTIEDFGLDTGEIAFKFNTEAFRDEPELKF